MHPNCRSAASRDSLRDPKGGSSPIVCSERRGSSSLAQHVIRIVPRPRSHMIRPWPNASRRDVASWPNGEYRGFFGRHLSRRVRSERLFGYTCRASVAYLVVRADRSTRALISAGGFAPALAVSRTEVSRDRASGGRGGGSGATPARRTKLQRRSNPGVREVRLATCEPEGGGRCAWRERCLSGSPRYSP
jgi:hypothetical protein